ncbi:MAG TPA: hypothetical protein VJT75_04655 [Thermoleophilaceae bacterium]|nr:hypothetical protein [Thermoleophilaceae bacterium]
MPRVRLALLLALAALCALPPAAGAVLSGINGRIMFVSGRDVGTAQAGLWMREVIGSQGAGGVFPAVAPVGGQQHRHPSWSPDRRQVAFALGSSGNAEIHVASLTEVADTTLTDTTDNLTADRPAWSPDGKRIAWEEGAKSGNTRTDIVVYDVATKTKTFLTQTGNVSEGKPAWSPDSQTIFYHRDANGGAGGNTQLNIVSQPASGGTETLRIPDSSATEFQPSISPDGTKICYTLQPSDSASAEILVGPLATPPTGGTIITADDGTGPGNPNLGNYNCTWSPDGLWVAYVRGTFNNGDLVMERSDGSDAIPLVLEETQNEFDGNPDWAPDGPPECDPTNAQVKQGKSVRVRLPCHDTGPAYERSNVFETVPGDAGPFKGTVGTVNQGSPSTVNYTARPKALGTDTFEFAGTGRNGGSDRGLATILILKNGACANMQTGNAKANKIDGTTAGDRLLGLGGGDRLRGFKGNDCLFGGAGGDVLIGGRDLDRLRGEDGPDTLSGGDANDRLNGGKGKDKYSGGGGNDRINSADGREEVVRCGAGKDDRATVDEDDAVHGCEHVTRR